MWRHVSLCHSYAKGPFLRDAAQLQYGWISKKIVKEVNHKKSVPIKR